MSKLSHASGIGEEVREHPQAEVCMTFYKLVCVAACFGVLLSGCELFLTSSDRDPPSYATIEFWRTDSGSFHAGQPDSVYARYVLIDRPDVNSYWTIRGTFNCFMNNQLSQLSFSRSVSNLGGPFTTPSMVILTFTVPNQPGAILRFDGQNPNSPWGHYERRIAP